MQTPLDATGWQQHIGRNTLTNGVTNALANGLICWLLFRDKASLVFWDSSGGFAADLLATGFLLAMIVTLILLPIQRKQLKVGSINAGVLSASSPLTRQLVVVTEPYLSAVALASLLGLITAAGTLLILHIMSMHSFSTVHYSVFKGLWAGCFSGALAYLIINLTGHRTDELLGTKSSL